MQVFLQKSRQFGQVKNKALRLAYPFRRKPALLFIAVLLVISLFYRYGDIAFRPPQSIHRWRQTDCTSIALNFYQHGMHFFKPEVHSLNSDGMTTGYAAGEAPVLYYFIAILYRIFGADDSIYRIFNTLLFLTGLTLLFRIGQKILNDNLMAGFIPILVFSSPTLAYYGCNYLPDTAALTFIFLGWWFFLRFSSANRYSFFLLTALCFMVAGLLKVTMAISLVALAGMLFFHHTRLVRILPSNPGDHRIRLWLPLIAAFIVISAWYLYAIRFNRVHNSTTFLTRITPWWNIPSVDRINLTQYIVDNNLGLYFSSSMRYFLALCLIVSMVLMKKIPAYLTVLTWMLLTGALIYVNLWYTQFQYHDYYFIVVLPPLAFLMITSFRGLKVQYPRIFHSPLFRIVLIGFITLNLFHARHEIMLRYHGWKLETPVYTDFFSIKPYLREIGINPDDRVISIPDATNCYTLYMMNLPGNNLNGINSSAGENIRNFINLGAKYLIVNDTGMLKAPELKEFTKNEVGKYYSIHIFKLD